VEFAKPDTPEITEIQTGEEVMVRNIDGSITTRMVISLRNTNQGEVLPIIKIKNVNDNDYIDAQTVHLSPERIVIEGLDDGERYDIKVRYKRVGSFILLRTDIYSDEVTQNNVLFEGQSSPPDDVTGFKHSASGSIALLSWEHVTNIDFDHYVIKFSPELSGVTWGAAQVLKDDLTQNYYASPLQVGTYLIKAFDRSDNESTNATLIVTQITEIQGKTVVATIDEDSGSPAFAGTKTNCEVVSGSLQLTDPSLLTGTYLFSDSVDLGQKYTVTVLPDVIANGENLSNTLDSWGVLDTVSSLSGTDPSYWEVTVQYRITDDDPNGSPVTWSSWADLVVGEFSFRAIEFRLILTTQADNISPSVSRCRILLEMSPRIVADNDLVVPNTGYSVVFDPAFKDTPKIVITAQDLATGNYWEITNQTRSGFDIIFKTSAGSGVQRTMDYHAIGFGQEMA
jgi:hypothetical protein